MISLPTEGLCGDTPGDTADVPATKLLSTYGISTLSFPIQSCRSRSNVLLYF